MQPESRQTGLKSSSMSSAVPPPGAVGADAPGTVAGTPVGTPAGTPAGTAAGTMAGNPPAATRGPVPAVPTAPESASSAPATPPSSWVVPAFLVTLLCFPLTGVLGMYYAAQVRPRWDLGDFAGSVKAAKLARLWIVLTFVLFGVLLTLGIATGALADVMNRVQD